MSGAVFEGDAGLDARLDEALEMTFPASDPIAVHSPDPPPRSSENREPVERA